LIKILVSNYSDSNFDYRIVVNHTFEVLSTLEFGYGRNINFQSMSKENMFCM